ncbi:hypothetical protein I79_001248 [Cricetulus griseus]|uniref:Uncharacterized protein n=1 Tax=Cricetulus griseus TaxID=10029 RepID=G3GU95_CRIGR|nr:hypothetical protein I79_001248 [Cricetulus griseus]
MAQWLRTLTASRGPRFNSQHSHGSSQLSVTLFQEIRDNFTQTYVGKTPMCIR